MLFATITKKLNRLIAPPLLKYGLTARYVLTQGIVKDTPFLDYLLLLPFSQALLSIEIQEIAKERRIGQIQAQNKVPSFFDKFVDRVWDKYLEPLSFPSDNNGTTNKYCSDNPRFDAFQEYIRPILTPTNQWSDIERYRFNQRFIKWLRSEYLICKYEPDIRDALKTFTQIKVTPMLWQKSSLTGNVLRSFVGKTNAQRGDFAPLPNASTLDKAFDMKGWNKTKSTNSEYHHMSDIVQRIGGHLEKIPRSSVQIANVPLDASVKDLSTEEILEVSSCHVSSCNAFNALCEEGGIYEFWTQEYVSALANYLLVRCNDFDGPTVIVDVGAGDGILVHFLNQYIRGERSNGFKNGNNMKVMKPSPPRKKETALPTIVATDDGSWKIHPKANVERLSVSEALQKYNPFDKHGKRRHQLIVICSWMPMGIDWTQEMRDNNVDEYILIGECDDGNCGDNWLTFGNPDFKDELFTTRLDESFSDGEVASSSVTVPYEMDGFVRQDLEDLSLLQYSRFDSKVSGSSKTVSFRKSPAN